MPMDTLGGEATIRWDLSIGVGGWGSLKLSDRLRTGDRDGRVEVAVAQLMLVKMWGDTGIWIEGNAW